MNVDLNRYSDFVKEVTSQPSTDLTTFMNRLDELDGNFDDVTQSHGPDINVPLLLTAALGLAAETGEFCEIPKKIYFQGKRLSDDELFHMKRELGDVMWYWINACRALRLDPNDVIAENVNKLKARYPGGEFDVYRSENRQAGDL
jgi:NTP pyrophosphatase (non-canonical NTP hydrolase)